MTAEYKYSLKAIQESSNPQNVGRMSDPDAFAEVIGECGDSMEFYLTIEDGIIHDIQFYTDGCGATIACGSIVTQMVKSRNIRKSLELTDDDIIRALEGLPEEHMHCARLARETLVKALTNYLKKKIK